LLFKSRYPKEIINSEFQESKAELQNAKKAERDDQPHQQQKKAAYYNDLAGDKWRRYKDYKGAIEAFNKSLQLDPTNWNVLSSRAVCKFEFKDYKGVISDVNATLEMQPGYTHLGLTAQLSLQAPPGLDRLANP
jgi:tetratricopeptide (TPR) repeat protein